MSSDDLFSSSPAGSAASDPEFTPSSPLGGDKEMTPGSPSPMPPNPTQTSISPMSSPTNLSPSFPAASDVNSNWIKNFHPWMDSSPDNKATVKQIKIEFLDENGSTVCQSRYTKDSDVITIIRSLVRSHEPTFRNETVNKLCKSPTFKHIIQNHVLNEFSKRFSRFLSSESCPLTCDGLLSAFEDLSKVDFERIFQRCLEEDKEMVSAFCCLCFGVSLENISERKHLKQRLVAVIAISAFSRSQKTNVIQKVLGEYFKLNSVGKQGLQLLQRLGLSLVPMSIRDTQDNLGSTFLNEVRSQKNEIEVWHERRKVLESIIKKKKTPLKKHGYGGLAVEVPKEKFIEEILDLGEYLSGAGSEVCCEPDEYIIDLVTYTGGEYEALEKHLDLRPKFYDITYDNLDMGRTSREYLMGQDDQSLHWTSSIIVEDVIDAKEIDDDKIERDDSNFDERIHLTMAEKEHLLSDYTQLLSNIVQKNWPAAFPDLNHSRIKHQYSKEFDREIKVWTGPLVCENESNLSGMSKIITTLTDQLCPSTKNRQGVKIPICPTTFSGDQKTEKAARSAQIALIDNGCMRDKLAFVIGRHELLHMMFMFTDVVVDIFGDSENLEEATCLSRLIKSLNPKLESKKGKDAFYAFRDVFSDIFVAQLGESLSNFLNVADLNSDVTPDNIRTAPSKESKMELFRQMMRTFIRESHEEYKSCQEENPNDAKLPLFYPHDRFIRKSKLNNIPLRPGPESLSEDPVSPPPPVDVETKSHKLKSDRKGKIDSKNAYFRGLLSILGVYQLLLDSIKEGNGLNSYLIQKLLLKVVQSTGHKNYSCSIMAFKNIVLKHPNPQYSHRYLWNIFAGRAGQSLNFPRDMKNEHLNKFLKNAFKSLGVNLNEKTAKRINNSADIGLEIEAKVNDFFDIDAGGKSHSKKNREGQIRKLTEIFRKEKSAVVTPGRVFKGPMVESNVFSMFDEAKFRAWHLSKEKELQKFEKLRENLFSSQ